MIQNLPETKLKISWRLDLKKNHLCHLQRNSELNKVGLSKIANKVRCNSKFNNGGFLKLTKIVTSNVVQILVMMGFRKQLPKSKVL